MSKFQEYIPIYEGDRFCLMCGQSCPVRRMTKSEATSPHGWALLISSVQRGMLPWNAETVNVLYQCADCGNCQGNCATDRPLPYAIQAARDQVVRLGHAPASVKTVEEKLRAWGNVYGEITDGGRFAKGQLATADDKRDVVLFVGDAAHFLNPELVTAAEKLLYAVNLSGTRFHAGRSSGYLPYTLGVWELAREMAQNVVRDLTSGGTTRVVTLSTQDAHTLQHVYAELGVTMPAGIKVSTLGDILAEAGDDLKLQPRAAQSASYTFHDSAQALRLQGHAANMRALAGRVMGSAPREMLFREILATPIGTSGGLEYTQPALAENLARTRIQEARATGAEIILTDDPLDTATLKKYSDGMSVLNLYEVLAERIAESK